MGQQFQSGWVDYPSSIQRDRRPRQRLVAGGGVTATAPVFLAGGAGSEMGEDLVDYRRLGDAGDYPHGAVAGGTRERDSGLRPREHAGGLVLVEEFEAYEKLEHGAAERLRQSCGVVGGRQDESADHPEAAVGEEGGRMRIPVGPRAMRLQAGHDADREDALARQRPDGGRDGAGGDAGDLAEQAAPIETIGHQDRE